MNTYADKTQENKSQSLANKASHKQNGSKSTFQFVDNRPEAIAQRKLQEMANNSPKVSQLKAFQDMANNSPQAKETAQLQAMADNQTSKIQSNSNGEVMQMMFMRPMLKGARRLAGASIAAGTGMDLLDRTTGFGAGALMGNRTMMRSNAIGATQALGATRFPQAAPLTNLFGNFAGMVSDGSPLENASSEFEDEKHRMIPNGARDVSSIIDGMGIPNPFAPLISADNIQSRVRELSSISNYNSESLKISQEEGSAQLPSKGGLKGEPFTTNLTPESVNMMQAEANGIPWPPQLSLEAEERIREGAKN